MLRRRLVGGVCSRKFFKVCLLWFALCWAPSRLPKNLSSSFVAKNDEQHVNKLGSCK